MRIRNQVGRARLSDSFRGATCLAICFLVLLQYYSATGLSTDFLNSNDTALRRRHHLVRGPRRNSLRLSPLLFPFAEIKCLHLVPLLI